MPALGTDLRQLGIGLGNAEFGARLHQLLVEIRCVDFGEHLTGFDLAADIVLPALQIAGNARVDRRPDIGFKTARKIKSRLIRDSTGSDHRDVRHRLRFGQILQSRILRRTDAYAEGDDADHQNQNDARQTQSCTVKRWRRSIRRCHELSRYSSAAASGR